MSDILKHARDLVVADEPLVKNLSSWYEADIRLGSKESYDEWLDVKLRHMIEQIEQWYDSAPDEVLLFFLFVDRRIARHSYIITACVD